MNQEMKYCPHCEMYTPIAVKGAMGGPTVHCGHCKKEHKAS